MEKVFLRFGHLGEEIFNSLDDKTLTDCSKVGKNWNSFIKNKKFFWIRIIKKYDKISNGFHIDCQQKWNKLFQKIGIEDIKLFA